MSQPKSLNINLYGDIHLVRFIVPFMVFDAPGDAVFATERGLYEGDLLTFRQSKSGINITSKEGFEQVLLQISDTGALPYWWSHLKKREFDTPQAMFRTFSHYRLVGGFPQDSKAEDEFTTDLLLLPRAERIEHALSYDPSRLLTSIVKVIYSFLIPEAYKGYKPRYRDKLITLASAFSPYRKEFSKFEIDPESPSDSMFTLLLFFS